MTDPEITLDIELDTRRGAEVRQALRRIRSEGTAGAWPSHVHEIAVTSVMSGGLSGALVLGIKVRSADHWLAHVAKIDSAAVLAAEWQSYEKWIKPNPNRFFAPIVAATPDVVSPTGREWGPGAVVYANAAQFDGRPDLPVRPLEDLVRAALDGSESALGHVLRVIELLLRGAAHVLYNAYEHNQHPSSLRSMNPTLGPNAVLEVGGPGNPENAARAWRPDDELLARTIGGPESAQLAPGDEVALSDLRPDPEDRPGIVHGDNIVVAIRPADRLAEPGGCVHGRVVTTRGAALGLRMLHALRELGPVAAADEGWDVAGTAVANPFGALLNVLTRPVRGRVWCVVHGDLNPRNALVVDDQPYLIDYSHTGAERPQQADFCWLELGLVRDVFAGLGFPALVALQRWLALAARVLDHTGGDAMPVVTILVDLVRRRSPDLAVPFQVLLEIRRCGRLVHPAWAGLPWHQDYLEQLLLAAHRAAKWTREEIQTPARMRATVAVASVATEHLAETNAFTRWTDPDLVVALATVEPVLTFADDDPVRLVHDLAAAMSQVDGPTEAVITSVRERVARTRSSNLARNLMAERDSDNGYIDLTAVSGGRHEAEVFSLIAPEPVVTVCGAPGSGKTTVLCEAAYRLATAILDTPAYADDPGALSPRVPVPVDAAHLARLLAIDDRPIAAERALLADSGLAEIDIPAFALGVPYLLVDNLDQVTPAQRRSVLVWLSDLCQRHPRLRMLVAQRQPAEPVEFGSHVLRLWDLDIAGMRAFLHRALAGDTIRGSSIDHLLRILLEEPEWQRLHPERPGVLAMVAKHIREFGLSDGVIAPADIIAEQLLGIGSAREWDTEELALVCERIAVQLLDERATDIPAASARHPDVSDPDGLLDHLVDRDVLRRHDDRFAFADETYRDYFAARALRRDLGAAPVDHVRRPNWHSALRAFVMLPGVADTPEILHELVLAAWHAAPVLTAHLIRDGGSNQGHGAQKFAASCRAVLEDDDSDDHEITEAVAALAIMGGPFGWGSLGGVVTADWCRTDSRVAALQGMAVPRRLTAAIVGWLPTKLEMVVLTQLVEPGPVPLRVAALRVIAAEGLRGLELYVGQFVAATEPWPVVQAAIATLRALGTALPQQQRDAHQAVCRQRLAEVDRALGERLTHSQAERYLDERATLLGELSGQDAVPTLLLHLFDFPAHGVGAALDHVIRAETGPDPGPKYLRILVGNTAADWSRIVVDGEPLEAAAAAHRLRYDPADATRALLGIRADAPKHRLLIGAALVAVAGDAGLAHAKKLFLQLLPTVDDDRLVGVAALLCAIWAQDRASGIRLAWRAGDVFADRDLAARHNWPWALALARCRDGVAELSSLIESGADDAVSAETALASRDFPRRCADGPRLRFEPSVRRRMLARRPDAGDWERARWAMAAANMDLVEALPELRAIAGDLAGRSDTIVAGTVHSGLAHRSSLADVLVVLGYLARRAFDLRASAVDDVYRLLSDPDVQDAPASIRTARLIGRAYLGDCLPLAQAVVTDPSLQPVALNAVQLWTPGPHTPQSLRADVAVAAQLAMIRDRPGLPVDARRALTQLTRVAERKAGVLFPRTVDRRTGRQEAR